MYGILKQEEFLIIYIEILMMLQHMKGFKPILRAITKKNTKEPA
jgi:hypothetical protein